ncbi:MAG: hypothetical protein D6729_19180 [Deltaproteobacteria bacterium]|nr:MAG: hypothetical protein D6729_19180 [Deltaproteobacteria bacterium]
MTWTHRITDANGTAQMRITRVLSVEGGRARLRSGTTEYVYEVRPGGLFLPAHGAWLLPWPLEVGRRWRTAGGEARVVETGARMDTPAGTFSGCVVIEAAPPEGQERLRQTFCKGVGPVRVEHFVGDRRVRSAVLLAFGRAAP